MKISNTIDQKTKLYPRMILYLLSILFFLILFSPTVLPFIKLIPLTILSVLSILYILKKKSIPLHPKVAIWIVGYITLNIFFLVRGTHNDLEVFIQLAPLNVLWPLLYTTALIIPSSKIKKFKLSKTFITATFFIEIYILYLYLNFINILPNNILLNLPLGQVINYNFGYVNFFIPSITSLIFLLPYLISLILIEKKRHYPTVFFLFLIIAGILISIVTGRRALMSIVAISPFISMFWIKIIRNKKYKSKFLKTITILILMLIISYIFLSLTEVGLRIQNLDTELIERSLGLRSDQFKSLLEGWKDSPILGAGLGVNAELIRSETVVGAYELSYVARLFQTGITGIIVYFFLIMWIIHNLVYMVREDSNRIEHIVPFLTGFSAMLIAEATNPYLSSFDGLWMFFYALALINNSYLNRKKDVVNES